MKRKIQTLILQHPPTGKNRRNHFIIKPSPRMTEEKIFHENVRKKKKILSLRCCSKRNASAII